MSRPNGTRIFIIVMVAAFLFSTFAFTGMVIWELSKGNDQNKTAESTEDIQKQLQDQLDQQNKAKGAKVESTDIKVGNGAEAVAGKQVKVHYTGTLKSNGSKFDSSLDRKQPFTFALGSGQVIQGWDQGVVGMKVGGKRKLVIPAALAYGDQERPGIPPNSDLVFEIELLEVK